MVFNCEIPIPIDLVHTNLCRLGMGANLFGARPRERATTLLGTCSALGLQLLWCEGIDVGAPGLLPPQQGGTVTDSSVLLVGHLQQEGQSTL